MYAEGSIKPVGRRALARTCTGYTRVFRTSGERKRCSWPQYHSVKNNHLCSTKVLLTHPDSSWCGSLGLALPYCQRAE